MAGTAELNMDDMWTLLLLSLAMLFGCYVAGSIPLAFSLSEEKLKLVSVMGAGLLVGTSLAVIIPEGVHTLYSTEEHSVHVKHTLEVAGADAAHNDHAGHDHGEAGAGHQHSHGIELHTYIGVSLVLGFIFMLLIDQLSGGGHMHSLANGEVEAGTNSGQNRPKNTATLGLVVHAAADGVALGAAATTSQTHVEMIVFVAIMLHKAPAAFGLVSFLLHEGLDRKRIRKHLAVFSAAAPLLAIITYFGLSQRSKETLSDVNATGIAMLFSAGTFLYVSTVHVLPEILSMGSKNTDGSVIVREHKGFSKLELTVMVLGSLLPLVLALGHSH